MATMKRDEEEASMSSSVPNDCRPMNAFLLFCKRHRNCVKEKYPTLENRNVTKILGDWWASLTPDDKSAYKDLALEYKKHLLLSSRGGMHEDDELSNLSNSLSGQESQRHSSESSAPKPFKKRFLATATVTSEEKSQEEVDNDDEACKALLQLAGVRDSFTEGASLVSRKVSEKEERGEEGFKTLKKAVWGRVAKTLLMQEEERLSGETGNNGDSPINLSTQCTIRGQTIIEHIIENILDKQPLNEDHHTTNTVNNNNRLNNLDSSSEQIKERIYQSLKQDMLVRPSPPDMCALRKSLPNPLAKKPKPSDSGDAADDDDEEDDEKRPSRSCKGRRYREFKEEGRIGRKRRHKSGTNDGPENQEEDPQKKALGPSSSPSSSSSSSSSTPTTTHHPTKPFNVSAKLNALPALSLEDYQQKMSKVKSGTNFTAQRRKSGEEDISRRRSRSRTESSSIEQLIA